MKINFLRFLLCFCLTTELLWASELDDLLQQVKQASVLSSKINQKREALFKQQKEQRQQMLNQAKQQLKQENNRTKKLNSTLKNNEKIIIELDQQITIKSANLGELFGVVRQIAGETNAALKHSIISIEAPERSHFLKLLANSTTLPSTTHLRQLWYEMQREMTESGKIKKLTTTVINTQGQTEEKQVTRIGIFNVVSDGSYLTYLPKVNQLMELSRQPPTRFQQTAKQFEAQPSGVHAFVLDPSRGSLLNLLTQAPSIEERIHQGGIIGYIILGVGLLALLITFERFIYLAIIGFKINRQKKSPTPSLKNPLGRIISFGKNTDIESLELQLDEAILRETPKLEKRVDFLGVLGAIAPLLGLLGTVIGMIETFQSIALFGTGDPKLMSSGISQALVTTGLGLIVAIPIILLHGFIQAKSNRLIQILDEESAGYLVHSVEHQKQINSCQTPC
ncbi:MAG: MotA/TolQ/ExbB proton channel family protein [Methylococcales bacterium]|jgi:biopolymer transport protein ExbB|nr:MotA/TolQ/ExbB proton channel family protein [Methylococcales bacterium]